VNKLAKELEAAFFAAYPSEELYDNPLELKLRFAAMLDAVVKYRNLAVTEKSVDLLSRVRTLDAEYQGLVNMAQQRHAMATWR
jgi:hypothetical protein